MKKIIIYCGIFILILLLQQQLSAQDDKEKEIAALAKTSQNPISSLTTLPFQFNFNLGMGEYDRTQLVINIEPVLPVSIGENWDMVNRIILPILIQPDFDEESGSTTGLGTINYTAFFSPDIKGKIHIGFGPSLLIPTNSAGELGD